MQGRLVGDRPGDQGLAGRIAADLKVLEPAGPVTVQDAAERRVADAADEPYEPSVGRGASLLANVPATRAAPWRRWRRPSGWRRDLA